MTPWDFAGIVHPRIRSLDDPPAVGLDRGPSTTFGDLGGDATDVQILVHHRVVVAGPVDRAFPSAFLTGRRFGDAAVGRQPVEFKADHLIVGGQCDHVLELLDVVETVALPLIQKV